MMDFGQQDNSKEAKKGKKNYKKIIILLAGILIITAIIAIYFLNRSNNPLPANIKQQINYKVVYPTSGTGKLTNNYSYEPQSQTLTFSANSNGNKIVFAEQPAPPSLGAGSQIYFPAIGLHPYAQFQSRLGPVALVKFYQSGSLKPAGESAVLASNGTLVIAHSAKNLTNEQWKSLITTLKITK
jgi:hypothetical protein